MTVDVSELKHLDTTEYLGSDEAISIFLADAFEPQNPGYVAHAVGVVAQAKGMTEIAKKSGISRELLCRSFGENGNPTLQTLLPILSELGIKLTPTLTHTSKLTSC